MASVSQLSEEEKILRILTSLQRNILNQKKSRENIELSLMMLAISLK